MPRPLVALALLALSTACADRRGDNASGSDATHGADTSDTSATHGDTAADGQLFDVALSDMVPHVDECKVVDPDGLDGAGKCEKVAPPDSFLPEVQWSYNEDVPLSSHTTPLVANLTDDNGDGVVDLCDTPDIVLVAQPIGSTLLDRHLYVLDGATGALHYRSTEAVSDGTPAVGDMDGDGEPEIVAVRCIGPDPNDNAGCQGQVSIFDGRDGSLRLAGDPQPQQSYGCHLALGDIDNDSDVEILCRSAIFDHLGKMLFDVYVDHGLPIYAYNAPALADLDGDQDLEIVLGSSAYHHDGTVAWSTNLWPGVPQIANLDADPEPEVLMTGIRGISVLEHDGAIKYAEVTPTGVAPEDLNWGRPATVHDFDGDGAAEFAMSSRIYYTVFEADASVLWSAEVSDQTGIAAGTAFDFLGDGWAEAMYADEQRMFVFDESGSVLFDTQRTSATIVEYPVVADVDNDGSAEIVVVSEGELEWESLPPEQRTPVVQVIREVEDRWIQARRIWNQHTYHVTNVREDGTIPQFEPPHWQELNTFRTNAQIEGGSVCKPEPQPEG